MLLIISVGMTIIFFVNIQKVDRREAYALLLMTPPLMIVLEASFDPIKQISYRADTAWLFMFVGLAAVAVALAYGVLKAIKLITRT